MTDRKHFAHSYIVRYKTCSLPKCSSSAIVYLEPIPNPWTQIQCLCQGAWWQNSSGFCGLHGNHGPVPVNFWQGLKFCYWSMWAVLKIRDELCIFEVESLVCHDRVILKQFWAAEGEGAWIGCRTRKSRHHDYIQTCPQKHLGKGLYYP